MRLIIMKKININDIDLENSFFHFDVRDDEFISKFGFPADIGPDSINAEDNAKVFFSKGAKGVLDLIDVWLIWRMNKEYFMIDNWKEEFLSEKYLLDEIKKNNVFDIMYDWLCKRKYYKVDLIKEIDYKDNDIDEAKRSVYNENECMKIVGKESLRFLFAKEMYKDKVKNSGFVMEEWNMHTIIGRGILPEKISLVVKDSNEDNAFSIIKYFYYKNNSKSDFRILNEFIEYCERNNLD